MRLALVVAALAVSSSAFAQGPATPAPAPTFSKDECAVWAREQSFADSVTKHDAKAFAEHVHPGAVFAANTPRPTRGRDAILKDWAGILDGSAIGLEWYPTVVVIGGEPDVALSSGPALIESRDPKAAQKYALVSFTSTWHHDSDGTWRVLLDGGTTPRPASEAEVAAFRAGRKTCPRG